MRKILSRSSQPSVYSEFSSEFSFEFSSEFSSANDGFIMISFCNLGEMNLCRCLCHWSCVKARSYHYHCPYDSWMRCCPNEQMMH